MWTARPAAGQFTSGFIAAIAVASTTRPHALPSWTTDHPQHSVQKRDSTQTSHMCKFKWLRIELAGTSRAHRSCVSGGPVGRQTRGLEPVLRKEGGGSGQKPRAGRWPGPRQTEPRTGDTPRTGCNGLVAVKVVGGGDVKAFPRCGEGRPGGGEAQEGRGSAGALTGSAVTALSAGSKALKSRMGSPARVKPQAPPSNDKRA